MKAKFKVLKAKYFDWSMIRWVIVGISTTATDYFIFISLYGPIDSVVIANFISAFVATSLNYYSHHKWTFKSEQDHSKSGTRYASFSLGIDLADLTGGFRIYSRQLFDSLNLADMNATGYCFQIEMALAAHLANADATEVPITFVERINGVSKMSRAIVIEALIQTTRWGVNRRLRPNADKLHYVK